MPFKQTYALASNPPLPTAWDCYSKDAARELSSLLAQGEADESSYQALLERHPCMLPCPYGSFGEGHHGLIHGAVVTQPRLSGLAGKIPDFLLLVRDSSQILAVFVEIESPNKRWFTQKGRPTADMTQAINQLREWKEWFRQPGNEDRFIHDYRLPAHFQTRAFSTRYVLVYGRREELQKSGYASRRPQHELPDERFFSYDSLVPSEIFRYAITARVDHAGYSAVTIPPVLVLGPNTSHENFIVRGKEVVAGAHPMMDPKRADFLRERFPYWDEWARGDRGLVASNDFE
jgi:Domain of unknown function (DUF4263)